MGRSLNSEQKPPPVRSPLVKKHGAGGKIADFGFRIGDLKKQRADNRGQRTKGKKGVCQERWILEGSFAVFAVAVGGDGQAEGMSPKMGHPAEKIHGFFRIFVL